MIKKADIFYAVPDFNFGYTKKYVESKSLSRGKGKKYSQVTMEPEVIIRLFNILGIRGFEECKIIKTKANKDNSITLIMDDPLMGWPKKKGEPIATKMFNFSSDDSDQLKKLVLRRQKQYDQMMAKYRKLYGKQVWNSKE